MMVKGLVLSLLLVTATVTAEYNETLAKVLLTLSASAYNEDPNECLSNRFGNAALVERYEVDCDSTDNNTCAAYIALIHDEQAIALVFRGTVGHNQLELEVLAGLALPKNFQDTDTKVNKYFDIAFGDLWASGIPAQIEKLRKDYPSYKLWVTGHSLGAALASLGSLALSLDGTWNESNSEHYTFAKPRVGHKNYADLHNKYVPGHYRVVHAHDTITNTYPIIFGYLHEKNWIWYNNDMTPGSSYVECSGEFDPKCAAYQILDSDLMYAHRHYFNVTVTAYGKEGCPTAIF
ncbi:unnamed protein product [Bursaphelenchus xylophilus]|uniref:(pine wood nematode) hypothetical protein n=1 Tax=Bursaphelenchus xylophilus TaxID=6326 RepID=A0A1I7RXV1_BURXY|nr:unnamed protein product [Bursaphelenchus xylophilus]CAG9125185.1 unnamed protein product [Bursaphelenchus xylophilus]